MVPDVKTSLRMHSKLGIIHTIDNLTSRIKLLRNTLKYEEFCAYEFEVEGIHQIMYHIAFATARATFNKYKQDSNIRIFICQVKLP